MAVPIIEQFNELVGLRTPERASRPLRDDTDALTPGKLSPETPSTTASTRYRSQSPQRKRNLAQSPSGRKLFPIPKPTGHSVLNLSTYRNSPRYTFQPPHRSLSGLNVPGPGAYTHDGRPVGAKPHAAMSARKQERRPAMSPGPQAYDYKTSIGEASKYSFGGPRSCSPSAVPGPGSYEARNTAGNGPHYSCALYRCVPMLDIPGPGTYDHTLHGIRAHSPQHSLSGVRSRKDRIETRPGPESYVIASHMGQGHKISHGVRRSERIDRSPGPGHYGGLYTTFH